MKNNPVFQHLYLQDVLDAADEAVADQKLKDEEYGAMCEKLFEYHWQLRNTLERLGLKQSTKEHTLPDSDEVVFIYCTAWKNVDKDFEILVKVDTPAAGQISRLELELPELSVEDETTIVTVKLYDTEWSQWKQENQLALSDGWDKMTATLLNYVQHNDREFAELRKKYLDETRLEESA